MGQFHWKKIDYTTPAGASGGPSMSPSITWYRGTPYLDMTLAQFQVISSGIGLRMGDTWWLGGGQQAAGGNAFKFVRSAEALTLGQVVAIEEPSAGFNSLSTAAALSTTSVLNWTAGGLTVNDEIGHWLWATAAGATLPQLRRVKSNTATSLTVSLPDYSRPNSPQDQDQFDTAAGAGNVAAIYRPHHVKVCTATDVPVGIALGTVTAGNYTIIQVAGLAVVQVDADGPGAGLVVGQPASCTAAGCILGTAGVANLYNVGSSIIPLLASVAAAGSYNPCLVNFLAG